MSNTTDVGLGLQLLEGLRQLDEQLKMHHKLLQDKDLDLYSPLVVDIDKIMMVHFAKSSLNALPKKGNKVCQI